MARASKSPKLSGSPGVLSNPQTTQDAKAYEIMGRQLAEERRAFARLSDRRATDLRRLAEVTRSRDLLEARLAAQASEVAAAMKKVAAKEKLLEDIEQRIGGFSLLLGSGLDNGGRARQLDWVSHPLRRLWWKHTVRAAQRARASGELIKARVLYDAALMFRQTPNVLTQLAHVLRELGLFDVAEAVYEHVTELDEDVAENIFLAGYCAEMAGRNADAARRYELALEKDPELVSRYDHLREFNARLFG